LHLLKKAAQKLNYTVYNSVWQLPDDVGTGHVVQAMLLTGAAWHGTQSSQLILQFV
jgi:hypothetical protein